jgi:phosphoribosylamine--glycine ligase
MKVLVVGSGAREHAIVRSLLADPGIGEVVAAPGNAGIAADVVTLPLDVSDVAAIADLAESEDADLVVVGPEQPLVNGAADAVRAAGIACFGPSAAAAMLEGSKAFAKDVMAAAGVPTAESHICVSQARVEFALDEFGPPYVVKDDGLAGGKGVVVTDDRILALEHGESCLAQGSTIVVEEFLDGPEVSLFVITDGITAVPLLPAQDFKRVGDGGTGPNTGGMGAYAPLPWAESSLVAEIMQDVVDPTLAEMARRGTPFSGVLYCGLALTARGMRVVEFNARFGDPEIQAVLALLESPFGQVLNAAALGQLAELPELRWRNEAAVNVVVAAQGYPTKPVKGDAVMGIDDAAQEVGVHVLHAGTSDQDGQYLASGGRVLSVVGVGKDVATARTAAYRGVERINLRGAHSRSDIAADV